MSRNLVVCLDGTWNDKDDPAKAQTNVAVLHGMALNDGAAQITYYDKGVGTDGWYDLKLGGFHGKGLSQNVREAYDFLKDAYRDGDKVFLFGFSRGAFTARSLAGLLYRCGLGAANTDEIYDAYRNRDGDAMAAFKRAHTRCPVEMIGVWDTVGALGIPVAFLRGASADVFSFHDTKLNDEVAFACHALAIDERRESFEPTLWTETPDNRHRIRQVWFAGVHSDIGGGYEDRHHSDIALKWMVDQATQRGLKLRTDWVDTYAPDVRKKIHDSAYKIFGLTVGAEERRAPVTAGHVPLVHASVREKVAGLPDYKPLALEEFIRDRGTLAPYRIEEG